jgi:2-methylcitrate dehydratase PrpD
VMMMAHSDIGFHSTGTIGTIGAAAAAARMLSLDVEATQHALGIAASRAAGLRVNVGTMTKPLHAGAAAMSGVQAARLAAIGWESHPQTLESPLGFCSAFLGLRGDREVDRAAEIGQRWSLLQPNGLAIKAYPSCGATHPAIDAALAVRAELDGAAIENVRVGVSAQAPRLLVYDRPRSGNEARFSAQYTVAAALLRGRVGLDDFTDAAVADPEVARLMERVDMVVDDRHLDSTQYPASVLVRTISGRLAERTVELARGKNANPLSEAELKAKFVGCAGAGSGELWHAIRHAEPDRPLAELMAATEDFVAAGGR